MRDNDWLSQKLQYVWQTYFPDLAQNNEILVGFGRRSKSRLGSIRLVRRPTLSDKLYKVHPPSIITINGHFRSEEIPELVVETVLAHELVHYLHGFCSPHDQAFCYPHQGGVVNSELKKRGAGEILKSQKKWIKIHWKQFLNEN